MSKKIVKIICIIFLFLACITSGVYILYKPSTSIQEQELVEIKDTAAYANKIEDWLVPDSLSPQREELITSAALLSAYGNDINLDIFEQFYLTDKDVLYEHTLEENLNAYLKNSQLNYRAISKNLFPQEIFELVDNGIPVICWITNDYKNPQWTDVKDEYYTEYSNEMTAIVKAVTNDIVILSDPLHGEKELSIDKFTILYEACGCHALWLREL